MTVKILISTIKSTLIIAEQTCCCAGVWESAKLTNQLKHNFDQDHSINEIKKNNEIKKIKKNDEYDEYGKIEDLRQFVSKNEF